MNASCNAAPLPTFTPTATKESSGLFTFGSKDDTPPEAPMPNSPSTNPNNILWGTAAAAALGAYMATTTEERRRLAEKKRRREARGKRNNSDYMKMRRAEKAGRLDEYLREKNMSERERKHRKELQAIWDANGAAIYDAKKAAEEATAGKEDDPYEGMEAFYENQDNINAEMMAEVPELKKWAEKEKAIKAQKNAKLDSATQSYIAMGAAMDAGKFPQDDRDKLPQEQFKQKAWWESVLEYQYTPVIAGAISVLATDAAFVLLAVSASPTAPATLAVAGICWGIGRVASLVGAVSTGYQYKNQLYGTTKFDLEITLATYGLSFIPKPDMAVMNHIGFLYSFYTTFIR